MTDGLTHYINIDGSAFCGVYWSDGTRKKEYVTCNACKERMLRITSIVNVDTKLKNKVRQDGSLSGRIIHCISRLYKVSVEDEGKLRLSSSPQWNDDDIYMITTLQDMLEELDNRG